jgi:hypothetical protein
LPRSVAEFFWAFLIYIDLPPSADPFERSAAIAREEFGLIHVEALGVYYRQRYLIHADLAPAFNSHLV